MRKIQSIFCLACLLFMTISCSGVDSDNELEESIKGDKYSMKLRVNIPHSETRVGVAQNSEGLDLTPFWVSGDKMNFYAITTRIQYPHKVITHLGLIKANNITEGGLSCEFDIEYPEGFDPWEPYTLVGVHGKDVGIVDDKIVVDASIIRTTLPRFIAPLWLCVDIDGSTPETTCKHIGAYEILHIKNVGNADVTFELKGYESEKKWYWEECTFYPEFRNWGNAKLIDHTGYSVKPIVKVQTGETAALISWYKPSADLFKNVTMVAEVDGKEVRTSNTKSSDIRFSDGAAYHLYVTWDGKKLTFDKGDITSSDIGIVLNDLYGEDL